MNTSNDTRKSLNRLKLSLWAVNERFDEYRKRQREKGETISWASVAGATGIGERDLRHARAGGRPLHRHQVQALAKLFGCGVINLVSGLDFEASKHLVRQELAKWQVPLTRVTNFSELVRHLVVADEYDFSFPDIAAKLERADAIDRCFRTFQWVRAKADDNPARTRAAVIDTSRDVEATGLKVLQGRYVARREVVHESGQPGWIGMHYVLVVQVRSEDSVPDFTIDRSSEPLTVSDDEDIGSMKVPVLQRQ